MSCSGVSKVGTWMQDDLCWSSLCLWLGVGGRSCSNFLVSTIEKSQFLTLAAVGHGTLSCWRLECGPGAWSANSALSSFGS